MPRRRKTPKEVPPPTTTSAVPALQVRDEEFRQGRGAALSAKGGAPLGSQPGQGGGGRGPDSIDGRGPSHLGDRGIQYPRETRGGQNYQGGRGRGSINGRGPSHQGDRGIQQGSPFKAQVPPRIPPLGLGEKRMEGAVVSAVATTSGPQPHLSLPSQYPSATAPKTSLETQFDQLNLREPSPHVSSKDLKLPPRPGQGQLGIKCYLKANHFFVELPDKDLHLYDVAITPDSSRGVNREVMRLLIELYRSTELGCRLPAYDGRKNLYTANPLPFQSKEFQIKLLDEVDGSSSSRRERSFKVVIKFAARADVDQLGQFLLGLEGSAPREALQALDIVLREQPTRMYNPVGSSFHSRLLGAHQNLGEGLESWRGFYQSIRPTQMGLSLNIDMSSSVFIKDISVIKFISELLAKDISSQQFLSNGDRIKIQRALRGVKVQVTHRGDTMRRKYRISGITSEVTSELSFPVGESGTLKTVAQYFLETYKYTVENESLPCLEVGNRERPNYLPMEICVITEGQRFSKRLNEKQINSLLKATCQRPHRREADIRRIRVYGNTYSRDPHALEFGIRINDQLTEIEARILPPPRLKYHDSGRVKDCIPQTGKWNMMNKKMVNGGVVTDWAIVNFSRLVMQPVVKSFCLELVGTCLSSGMSFSTTPLMAIYQARSDQVERELRGIFNTAEERTKGGKGLDLLVVILPDNNGGLYGDLKRICETDLGMVSQCCLTKHVNKFNRQYLANLALKINVKVGGKNTVLYDALHNNIPLVTDVPTIIFGADVTHPNRGEDISPSIAAVVASQDWPEVTKYTALVCAQAHRQELIENLYTVKVNPNGMSTYGGMIRDHMISFRVATGKKPERIIFYRDGVSEGQFHQVLLYELDAIRKACDSLEPNYQPPVTFVVVQKRHHTRLFARDHSDRSTMDESGNILPGTVVDSKICHPTEFDFYLCSHAGIQGTSRPAHYHVLWDENNFKADELQSLTNNLCYTYARCTRSVSIVPPVYYAHLAAFRARFYVVPEEESDSGSLTSGIGPVGRTITTGSSAARRTCAPGTGAVKSIPPLKERVQKVMFYC